MSIVIFLVATAIGGAVYGPLLRRQMELAEGDSDSEEYRRLDRRGNIIEGTIAALVVFLIYMMVFQPAFWDRVFEDYEPSPNGLPMPDKMALS
ncbi:MAG: hypothetical protein IIC24_04355 [Chloroflexi bacterium]|nr:hypothetical protein [Chloroflexota bacterium]